MMHNGWAMKKKKNVECNERGEMLPLFNNLMALTNMQIYQM